MFGLELICLGVLLVIAFVWFIRDPESFMGCAGCGFLFILIIVGVIVVAGVMGFDILTDFLSSVW